VFQRNVSLILKMKAIFYSKTLVTTHKTMRRHNPGDHNLHLHRRENLKSLILLHCINTHSFWGKLWENGLFFRPA
jgi:hypothetical protein